MNIEGMSLGEAVLFHPGICEEAAAYGSLSPFASMERSTSKRATSAYTDWQPLALSVIMSLLLTESKIP
jgi:hypothetical protein